jgi:Flp pilus assembly protein TadD
VDEAIAHFRTAIALRFDYPEAHLNLGIAYGDKGWLEQAREEMSLGMRLQGAAKRGP